MASSTRKGNLDGSRSYTIIPTTPHDESAGASLDWFSSLRGRIGFATDKWLLYLTGGGVLARSSYESRWINIRSPLQILPSDGIAEFKKTSIGYAIGGGGEYAISDRFSLRAEYLYLGIREWNATGIAPTCFNNGTGQNPMHCIHSHSHFQPIHSDCSSGYSL